MIFGQAVTGVSNSMLLGQRRAVGAATALAEGSGGQDLDAALILADGSAKGRADPAFPAHGMPIGAWAAAVWDEWMPVISMGRLIQFAKAKVLRAVRPWSVVHGPAAAFVATCERLGWKVTAKRRWKPTRAESLI